LRAAIYIRANFLEVYVDVEEWVKTCEECQRRARIRYKEPLHPT
jgi:hypothetical protein